MKRWMALGVALVTTIAGRAMGAVERSPFALPAGTTLHVRLDTTITSKTNKPGDTFTARVEQAVVSGDQTIVPEGSTVTGHVAFLKPSGRIKGRAQMRVVLDSIRTPDDQEYRLSGTLEDSRGGVCGNSPKDAEGTIEGCGKSKKEALKDAAIAGAVGAGVGGAVATGQEVDCRYFGNCGGAGLGTDVLYGAGIGAGTALLFNLFKHEKQIILLQGTKLTFIVNRTLDSGKSAPSESQAQSLERR